MIGTRARRTIPIAFAILVLPALPARAGAAPTAVYSVRTSGAVTLADAGGTPTTIESLVVPRGAWTVMSNVIAVDPGSGDYVRCNLRHDGTVFDGGATTYVDETVADLTNSGVVKTTGAATTIALVCQHDQNAPTPSQFSLDPGATLTAVVGGPVKGATVEAGTGPNVVQTRTTSQTPIAMRVSTAVEQIRVAAGTWALHVNFSLVNFSGSDFANCSLSDAKGGIATQQVDVGDFDALVSNLSMQGARTYAKATTVKVTCSSLFTTGVYIDPGATLIATRVAPADLVSGLDTKTSLPDTGGKQLTVFHQSLPAGAWRVSGAQTTDLSNPNHSIGGAGDFVRCGLYAANHPLDGGARTQIVWPPPSGGGNYEQMIVESGTHTATKPWTLSIRCSHDTTIATGSHWTVAATNPVVAIQQGPIASSVI